MAQAVEAAIEGPITAIDVVNNTITVMDIVVSVPPGTPISTPTSSGLSLANLAAAPPFPGRSVDGFLGGTAIINGESLGGVMTASDVFSDLFENVVVGEATDTDGDPNTLHLLGMLLEPSTDPRMPAGTPTNGFGFEIVPSTIAAGSLTAAEGYFGDDQVLRWHTLESDGGDLVNAGLTEVSITRAQCRDRGNSIELEVRGGVHDPASGPVLIQRQRPNPVNGFANVATVQAVADAEAPGFGAYRLTRTVNNVANCPALLKAVFLTKEATAVPESR